MSGIGRFRLVAAVAVNTSPAVYFGERLVIQCLRSRELKTKVALG